MDTSSFTTVALYWIHQQFVRNATSSNWIFYQYQQLPFCCIHLSCDLQIWRSILKSLSSVLFYHIYFQYRWHQRNNACDCQWMISLWYEASVKYCTDFGNHFSDFSLSKKYCPDFFIKLTFTSFEGSFISLIKHMNHSHPENKPFHFRVDSTVLLSQVTRNAQLLLVLLCRHVLLDNNKECLC